MSHLKKKIPLIALEVIEPLLKLKSEYFALDIPGQYLLKFVDRDEHSDFFFIIEGYQVDGNTLKLSISKKPSNAISVESSQVWIVSKDLEQTLKTWVSILERYSNIRSIYDDPIDKKYFEEFSQEFKIVDEDADLVGFNLDQQLYIDNYLEKVIAVLDKHNPDDKDEVLNGIKIDASDLKNNLTKLTKKKVLEALVKIWVKARKYGLIIIKEIFIETRKEIIKQLIVGQLV